MINITFKPYSYLCPSCCYECEIPTFVDGKCPECGCDKLETLYSKHEVEDD